MKRREFLKASPVAAAAFLESCAPTPELAKTKTEQEVLLDLDHEIDMERKDPDTELNKVNAQRAFMNRENPRLLEDFKKYGMMDKQEYLLDAVVNKPYYCGVVDDHSSAAFMDQSGKFVFLFFRPKSSRSNGNFGRRLPEGMETLPSKGIIIMATREYKQGLAEPTDKYELTTIDEIRNSYSNSNPSERDKPTPQQQFLDIVSRRFDRNAVVSRAFENSMPKGREAYNAVVEANRKDLQTFLEERAKQTK